MSPRDYVMRNIRRFEQDYASARGNLDRAWFLGGGGPSCAAAVSFILGGSAADMQGQPVDYQAVIRGDYRGQGGIVRNNARAVLGGEYELVAFDYNVRAHERGALHRGDNYLPRPGDMWMNSRTDGRGNPRGGTGGHIQFVTAVRDLGGGRYAITTEDNSTMGSIHNRREHIVRRGSDGWITEQSMWPMEPIYGINKHGKRVIVDYRLHTDGSMYPNPLDPPGSVRWVIDTDAFFMNGPQAARDIAMRGGAAPVQTYAQASAPPPSASPEQPIHRPPPTPVRAGAAPGGPAESAPSPPDPQQFATLDPPVIERPRFRPRTPEEPAAPEPYRITVVGRRPDRSANGTPEVTQASASDAPDPSVGLNHAALFCAQMCRTEEGRAALVAAVQANGGQVDGTNMGKLITTVAKIGEPIYTAVRPQGSGSPTMNA